MISFAGSVALGRSDSSVRARVRARRLNDSIPEGANPRGNKLQQGIESNAVAQLALEGRTAYDDMADNGIDMEPVAYRCHCRPGFYGAQCELGSATPYPYVPPRWQCPLGYLGNGDGASAARPPLRTLHTRRLQSIYPASTNGHSSDHCRRRAVRRFPVARRSPRASVA